MYIKRNMSYQKILLEQERKIFRTADLAVLWEIEKPSSLRTTIQRYKDRQILYPIQRGLYAVSPLEKLDGFELGRAVSGPFAYVSGETVLAREGVIMQQINKITLFGKKQKEFELAGRVFLCRYLNPKFLMNREGVERGVANTERAMADILYINPNYYIDNQLSLRLNKIKLMQRKVGYI